MYRTTILVLGGLLACSGCALMQKLVGGDNAAQVDALEKAGNYDELATECAKPQHYKACDAKKRVGARRLAGSTCDDLGDNFTRYYSNPGATEESDLALVRKFTECKQTDDLFGRDQRIRWLPESLATLDKEGVDVFARFVAFVGAGEKLYSGESGVEQANQLARWLVAVGDASRCATVEAQLARVDPAAHGEFVWMYYELGCGAEALPRAREFLLAEQFDRRIQGCDVLGKFADASALEQLNTLAETDPMKDEREVRTPSGAVGIEVYYPVREACRAASGQVRLRNPGAGK